VSSVITYELNATLESLGYTESTANAAYEDLKGQITGSILSGKFQQDLKAAGQTKGVTTFANAEVNQIPTYGPLKLTLLVTAAPSYSPTPAPTREKKKNSDDDGDVAAIAGGVVGGFFGLLLIGFIIYYCASQQRRDDLEEKFRQHNIMSSKPAAGEGAGAGAASGGQPQLKSMESIDQVFDKRGSTLPTHTNDVNVNLPSSESKTTSGERRSARGGAAPKSKPREDHRDRDDFL
jgi:hypothetical protein